MEDTEQIETTDQSKPEHEPGKSKQKRVKKRGPDLQLQSCLNTAEELLASPTLKEAKKCDLLISRMSTLHDLMLAQKEEDSETAAKELETLKQQLDAKDARIAELETECEQLRASQHPVEIRTVPDPETPQLRADLKLKDDILNAIAEAVKSSLSHPQRINFAAVLVTKYGRACQSFLNQVTDFSLIWCASQKRDDELQEVISLAQPNARGDGVLAARAVLEGRGVPIIGPSYTGGSSRFKDEFNGEYATEL